MDLTLNIRYYKKDHSFAYEIPYPNWELSKVKTFAETLLKMDEVLGTNKMLPLNPCNISLRGPDGRFVKWRN